MEAGVRRLSTHPSTDRGTLAADRGEIRSLTGLRLFAAVWVVVFHFQFTEGEALAGVLGPFDAIVEPGALGVDLFYVLSGFVIALTYLDKVGPALRGRAAATFLWARVCRIWPVFALVTNLFGLFLLAKLVWGVDGNIAYQGVQPSMTLGAWLQQMFMVQMWDQPYHDGASWVGPAWSISAEWLAYVLFPLTGLLFFRMRRLPRWVLALLAVSVMAPVAAVALGTGSPYFPYSWLVRIAAGFTAGVLVYLVVAEIPRTERVRRLARRVSWAALVGIVAGLLAGAALGGQERGGIVLVLFPVLVGALALSDGGPSRVCSTRWAVHGGRISYSLYLVHVPLFEIFWTAMLRFEVLRVDGVLATVLTPVVFIGTFVAAHLLWRFVEEPSRRRLRRLPASGPVRWAAGRAGTASPVPRHSSTVDGPRR